MAGRVARWSHMWGKGSGVLAALALASLATLGCDAGPACSCATRPGEAPLACGQTGCGEGALLYECVAADGGASLVWVGSCSEDCGEGLVDLARSREHCGRCGNACPLWQPCIGGECTCPTGFAWCDATCVDVEHTDAHCGGCGRACDADRDCVRGVCECAAGTTACGADCPDLESSAAHCGACGATCAGPEQTCMSGHCCPTGWELVFDGGVARCVDVLGDAGNCGRAGLRCWTDEPRCIEGGCVPPRAPTTARLDALPTSSCAAPLVAPADLVGLASVHLRADHLAIRAAGIRPAPCAALFDLDPATGVLTGIASGSALAFTATATGALWLGAGPEAHTLCPRVGLDLSLWRMGASAPTAQRTVLWAGSSRPELAEPVGAAFGAFAGPDEVVLLDGAAFWRIDTDGFATRLAPAPSADLGFNRCADGWATGLSWFDGTSHHVAFARGADVVTYDVENAMLDTTPIATLPASDACSLAASEPDGRWAFARPTTPIEITVCEGFALARP